MITQPAWFKEALQIIHKPVPSSSHKLLRQLRDLLAHNKMEWPVVVVPPITFMCAVCGGDRGRKYKDSARIGHTPVCELGKLLNTIDEELKNESVR